MKRSLALLLSSTLLMVGLTAGTAAAQAPTQPKSAAPTAPARPLPTAAVTQQIAMAEERMRAALIEQDVAHVDDATADLFAATLPFTGKVLDKARVLAGLKSGELKFQSIKLTDVQVRVITPVVGVVTARAIVNFGLDGGKLSGDYQFQYTRVWVRLSARWQQVAWQGMKVP